MEPRRAEHSSLRPEIGSNRPAARAARGYGEGGAAGRASGLPYTEKPAFDENFDDGKSPPLPKQTPRWRRTAALVAAAVLLAGAGVTTLALKPEWRPWTATYAQSAATQNVPRVTLTSADVDQAATAAARAALLRGEIPASLANVDVETRRRIASGEESLYTKRLLETPDPQPGGPAQSQDVRVHVIVTINGQVVADDVLTREHPATTPFPAGPGAATHFHFTVEQPGEKGTVTCSVRSNTAGMTAVTPPLARGESGDLEAVAP